jgi:hypothetical protein
MFLVGQRVWHRDGQRSGKVLECDGNRVFIEQDNGAELDFSVGELAATPPVSAKVLGAGPKDSSPGLRQANYVMPNRILIAADITPEHARVLSIVPVRTLNVIAEITAVPYRTMREYSGRPGELGLLMGKGLADSQRAGR